ncbi:uncharacterized protein LOC128997196 [Macrosteles quadrilineatus]|uniref:uncharacterized protein LOC128997196 n=1 Tax=Macrosteles quadrilineatus TaxID=74068 RepID=UPI0023E26D5F|nr:uncharacterized protein LOC128997196 [Macrosteles quadrilineatus]
MDALVKKRSTIKAQLTRFGQFFDNSINSPGFLNELYVRLPKAEQLLDKFDLIQHDIELEDDEDAQQVERETFESTLKIIGKAKSFTTNNQENTSIQMKTSDRVSGPKLNLPVLNQPSFDGSFDDWFPFSDMFWVVIHNNESLTDIEKLHYLKSCLKKEAFDVISSLELTSTNYAVARNLIQETTTKH